MSNPKLLPYYLITLLLITSFPVHAENLNSNNYRFESIYNLDNSKTRDYFLDNGQNGFSINFRTGTSAQDLTLTLRELNFDDIPFGPTVDENGNKNNLERISLAYEYKISAGSEKILPFNLNIAIDLKTDILQDYLGNTMMERKIMHYWDEANNNWRPLYSVGDVYRGSVRARSLMPEAIVAVFIAKKEFEAFASWYPDYLTPSSKYNGASNKYPIGTHVKICRLDNLAKCVKIKIVSTGPYVDNRIVDLTKTAFAIIGNPGGGIVGVRVVPIK